jgi:hypothetical protein
MIPRQRTIFLVMFTLPILNLLVLGSFYHIQYAKLVAGPMVFMLGTVYLYFDFHFRRTRQLPTRPRTRIVRNIILLYIGFAICAIVNANAAGWHWYDLCYLIFPTAVGSVMFSAYRKSQKNTSEQLGEERNF